MELWQWLIGLAVPIAIAIFIAFRVRSNAATSERGKDDYELTKVAREEIAFFDGRLSDMQGGHANPPRLKEHYSIFTLNEHGRISGFTSGTGPFSTNRERILVARCLEAVRQRGRCRRGQVKRLLVELSGPAVVDLAGTTQGSAGNDWELFAAAYKGHKRYEPSDLGGWLGEAFTEGHSGEIAVQRARALLARLSAKV